jgi:hypothetical protein
MTPVKSEYRPPDSFCLEIQALSEFVCSNKIEILNVAGSRESKEAGVYDWTLTMLRLFLNADGFWAGSTENSRQVGWGREEGD